MLVLAAFEADPLEELATLRGVLVGGRGVRPIAADCDEFLVASAGRTPRQFARVVLVFGLLEFESELARPLAVELAVVGSPVV